MSGGYFDYQQHRIGEIAEQVEDLILNNKDYSEKTIAEFQICLDALKIGAIYAQRIDWLVSGDDAEEDFHKRLADELMSE